MGFQHIELKKLFFDLMQMVTVPSLVKSADSAHNVCPELVSSFRTCLIPTTGKRYINRKLVSCLCSIQYLFLDLACLSQHSDIINLLSEQQKKLSVECRYLVIGRILKLALLIGLLWSRGFNNGALLTYVTLEMLEVSQRIHKIVGKMEFRTKENIQEDE